MYSQILIPAGQARWQGVVHSSVLYSFRNRVKRASSLTGSQPETPDGADLHTAAQKRCRPAVVQAVVKKFRVRVGNPIRATRACNIGFLGFHTDP